MTKNKLMSIETGTHVQQVHYYYQNCSSLCKMYTWSILKLPNAEGLLTFSCFTPESGPLWIGTPLNRDTSESGHLWIRTPLNHLWIGTPLNRDTSESGHLWIGTGHLWIWIRTPMNRDRTPLNLNQDTYESGQDTSESESGHLWISTPFWGHFKLLKCSQKFNNAYKDTSYIQDTVQDTIYIKFRTLFRTPYMHCNTFVASKLNHRLNQGNFPNYTLHPSNSFTKRTERSNFSLLSLSKHFVHCALHQGVSNAGFRITWLWPLA
jgi:hypothetical protein